MPDGSVARGWPPLLVVLGGTAMLMGTSLLFLGGRLSGGTADPPTVRSGIEVPVTAMDQGIGYANNSPTLLADPDDPDVVALASRLDAPDFGCALHLSGDGGHSWTPVQPVPKLPEGAEKCYAPEIAFNAKGVLHYLFVGLAGRGNEPMGVFLTTSSDRGRTFAAPRQVLGPLNFAVRMAIDPDLGDAGRLHLVWINATSDPPLGGFGPAPNPILASHSDDGGRTFSRPVQVNDQSRLRVVAPALSLGLDHSVHVAYYDLERDAVDYQGLAGPVWEETWSLIHTVSTDRGERFGPESVIEGAVVPPERVMLIFTMTPPALVTKGSRVCSAWTDGRQGDSDVVARCSGDRGRVWGAARRLNDDAVGNGLSQFMPRLAFSPDGRLDAIFYDRRRHHENGLNHVFFTFSHDEGHTWAPNIRLTRHASSSVIGQRYTNPSAEGKVEFGSRLGLLSRSDATVAAWTDTRNSHPNSTGQDVFSVVVTLRASRGSRSTLALGGAGLLVLGAIAAGSGAWAKRWRNQPVVEI